ncbi:MAG: D-alanyl-D-alanine carboxypeptidase/D-alanyl-D-alanine-endopeptidase [Planctomycetota bacterium]
MGGLVAVRVPQRRCRGAASVALWVAALAAVAPSQDRGGVDAAIAAAEADKVRTGVAAVELDGTFAVRHRADERFVPASNLKLVTAAAVLRGLTPGYRFTTRFALRQGRLQVRAGGDPNWIAGTEHAPEGMYRGLVAALQRLGVERLRGIDLDPGPFTGPDRPADWPQDQLDAYYCAPTGPFVLEQGTFVVRLEPAGSIAAAALVAPFVQVPMEGRVAVTDARRGAVYGAYDRGDRIRLQGKIWRGSDPVEIRVAVREPGRWFELALEQALLAGGIRVDAGAPSTSCEELYEFRTPLLPALQRTLEDSSNFDAEQLARVLGAERRGDGSLAAGVTAVRAEVEDMLGGAADGLQLVDGSGLSRGNLVTPALLVRVLRATAAAPEAAPYVDALPLAGRTGTLEDRFTGSRVAGRVRAKTGWIRGASALSGLLQRSDGSRCAFAILMNYDPGRAGLNQKLKQLQERIVEALDRRDGQGG